MSAQRGRHFLQIPGPTNVPDRILRAIDAPVIDHRGPEFARLTLEILEGLKRIFKTSGHVVTYPESASGAWEAAAEYLPSDLTRFPRLVTAARDVTTSAGKQAREEFLASYVAATYDGLVRRR